MRTFNEILELMRQIHEAKAHDYTSEGCPLGNFIESERIGVEPFKACFIRLQDKYSRACNLISGMEASVQDETLEDTLVDLANYAILTLQCVDYQRNARSRAAAA